MSTVFYRNRFKPIGYLGESVSIRSLIMMFCLQMEPELDMMSLFVVSNVQPALVSDATVRTPMTADVNTPAEIRARFNYASYQKGEKI